jgi:RNA polymerase sigma-70 factor, ECF subfamily
LFWLNELRKNETFSSHNNEEKLVFLMEKYGASLNKIAFTYLKDWGKAEDVVQDVFISCYKNLDNFREEAAYKTWLYRITVNKCIDQTRKKRLFDYFSTNELRDLFIKSHQSAESEVFIHSDNQELADAVMNLPIKYREVVVLYYYECLSIKEIAHITDLNAQTVKTRLKRAKEQLRRMYERKL